METMKTLPGSENHGRYSLFNRLNVLFVALCCLFASEGFDFYSYGVLAITAIAALYCLFHDGFFNNWRNLPLPVFFPLILAFYTAVSPGHWFKDLPVGDKMLASYVAGFSAAWFFPSSYHIAIFSLPLALAVSFFVCGAGGFSDSCFAGCRLILFSGNPNKLSFLAGAGVLAAIFASRQLKGRYRNFAIFAGGVNMLILILTSSRAALGATFLSILFVGVVFLRRHFSKIVLGLLISGLAVFFFLPSAERDRLGCAISAPSQDETLKRRVAIWDVAVAGIKQRPLIGNALRSFRKFYADYTTANYAALSAKYGEFKEDPSHPHNLVLGLAYMYGLIGLPLFFLAFVPALRLAFLHGGFIFIAFLLFSFLNGMFDFNLHRVAGSLLLFFPLGLEYGALARKHLKPDTSTG